jgi:hypothetical protein
VATRSLRYHRYALCPRTLIDLDYRHSVESAQRNTSSGTHTPLSFEVAAPSTRNSAIRVDRHNLEVLVNTKSPACHDGPLRLMALLLRHTSREFARQLACVADSCMELGRASCAATYSTTIVVNACETPLPAGRQGAVSGSVSK